MSSTTTTAKAAGQSAAIRVVAIAAVAAVYKIFFAHHINPSTAQPKQGKPKYFVFHTVFVNASFCVRIDSTTQLTSKPEPYSAIK